MCVCVHISVCVCVPVCVLLLLMLYVLLGWWFECRFRATGRFVHTALTDPTLNTNIKLWSVALLFITVAVVVVIVIVHSVLLFMWFMFFFFFFFLPCTKKKKKNTKTTCQSVLYQQYKITAILDKRLLQQPSRQKLGTEKYVTQGIC